MGFNLRAAFKLNDDFSATAERAKRKIQELEREARRANRTFSDIGLNIRNMMRDIDRMAESTRDSVREVDRLTDSFNNTDESVRRLIQSIRDIDIPDIDPPRIDSDGFNLPNFDMPSVIKIPIIVIGASAAIAAIAPVTAAVGGLTASLSAAGVGAIAFGAVAVSSLTKIFEAAEDVEKIQEKIDNATTLKQRLKAERELAGLYKDMSGEQKGALKTLQKFQSFWGDFTAQFDKPVFKAFTYGLEITQKLLKGLEPTINRVAAVTVGMLGRVNRSFTNGGMKGFFDWLETNAARSLQSFSTIAGNTIGGVAGILKAFTPTGKGVEQTLIGMTQKFEDWGMALEKSKGFQNFLEYAKENAPKAKAFIEELVTFTIKSIQALAPIGSKVLGGINKMLSAINNNFTTFKIVVGGALAVIMGFGAIATVAVIIRAVTFSIATMRRVMTIARIAAWGLRVSMLAFPGAWIIAAIGGVVMAGIWMYKNWDTVKAKTQQLWNKLKEIDGIAGVVLTPIKLIVGAAAEMASGWDKTRSVWENVWSGIQRAAATAVNSVIGDINKMIGVINSIPGIEISTVGKVSWGSTKPKGNKNHKPKTVKPPKMFRTPSRVPTRIADPGRPPGFSKGLANVPVDEMNVNVHKEEAILRADQANALRRLGVLKSSGGRPVLDTSAFNGKKASTSTSKDTGTAAPTKQQITINGGIHIHGAQKTTKQMARELVQQIQHVISAGGA